ncbi:MAG: peptidase [Gemmatimonadetes bacterium]|nr:peptidase [Gemmatimonadota bacterium]
MKAHSLLPCLVVALAACRPTLGSSAPLAPDSLRIRRDIEWLADDAREGRGTGSAGNDSSAAWIARRYASLGLAATTPGYLQPFVAHPVAAHSGGAARSLPTQNVIALLRGSDAALANEYVIVGAHFDHLGRSTEGAMDPEAKDVIRNGADDNASGTAAVLELARLLKANPPKRSVIFANFTGEELGLLGSQYFTDHPSIALERAVAMVNFDMVGRLKNDKLIVYGVATAPELPAILDSANATTQLRVSAVGDGFGPSDHASFYAKNLPVLHFFTDIHDDYHRASDDADKVNAAGEARVLVMAERVIRSIADRPARLTFVRAPVTQGVTMNREGSNVWLGSVPDMSAGDVKGLRLSGVRPGSPADKGGLVAGDVIVEFGGKDVSDIYSYTNALYSHKPGDVVGVVVLRAGVRTPLTVTLAARP